MRDDGGRRRYHRVVVGAGSAAYFVSQWSAGTAARLPGIIFPGWQRRVTCGLGLSRYKDKGGEKTGPLPVDLLEALWVSGEIDGMTEVWKEGMDAYVPVAQVRTS